jgi:hypothetical protein
VVDLSIKRLVGGLPTSWRADLPTVSPNGSLLLRRGNDVAAVRPDSLLETGRVVGGASDLWVTTDWSPRGARSSTASSTAGVDDSVGVEGPLYVQVSVSRNQTWSGQMAEQLIRAGLPAKVLPPASADEGFRVVLGPYTTRAQAEAIGRNLVARTGSTTPSSDPAHPAPLRLDRVLPPLLRECALVAVVPVGDHAPWSAEAAWAVARARPPPARRTGAAPSRWLISASMLRRCTRSVPSRCPRGSRRRSPPMPLTEMAHDIGGVYFLAAGAEVQDPDAVRRSPRWSRLQAGFRSEHALLLVCLPADRLLELGAVPDGVIALAPLG